MSKIKLKPGTSYKIQRFRDNIDKSFRKKLLSMGMTPGSVIEVIRQGPMKGPIEITCKGTSLCLRNNDLLGLEIIAQA